MIGPDQRRIIDISQVLGPQTPVWPGDTPVESGVRWDHGVDSPVRVSWFRSSTHGGTHADAPLHYDPSGAAIDAVDLHAYLGRVRVIDVRGCGALVTADMLRPWLTERIERVLLRTFERFPHDRWPDGFAAVSPEAIDLLAAHGVLLIGTDTPSLDPETSKTMDAHQAVRRAGIRVLEGLVLDHVASGDYELIALPLPLAGLDAAPVRAVLRTLS
ncbi:arylformamidase [Novosphingobium sp.]|uniref:arylformamidase n=1 Tax=Novosphingobium sp. TaxID=1874826 RepID=UPI0025D5D328|nr:arylformamidase [Novosphingobium sp.]